MMKTLIFFLLLSTTSQVKAFDYFDFFSGFITGLAVHEIGHEFAATINGEKLTWHGLHWRCNCPDEQKEKIALGGFIAQNLTSEFLLKNKLTTFKAGIVTFSAVNTVTYAINNKRHHGGYKDLKHHKNGNTLALYLIAHQLHMVINYDF